MEIESRVKNVVTETLKIKDTVYNEDLAAGDIPEWDSIGHVNLLMAVEKEFEVAFDIGDSIEVETVGDIIDLVTRYTAKN